jgi:hypothetical protein
VARSGTLGRIAPDGAHLGSKFVGGLGVSGVGGTRMTCPSDAALMRWRVS